MLKRCLKLAIVVVPIVVAVVLVVTSVPTQAGAPSAPTDVFTCTPFAVAAFETRVHVRCTQPYNTTIYYFAYCATKDSATASRMLSVFTTAKATGKDLFVYFTPSDTSGTACGCATADCRVVTGAEVRP